MCYGPHPEDVGLGAGWLEAQQGERCILRELHCGGYLRDPNRLAARAAGLGFTGAEVGNPHDDAATVHARQTFRLRETRGPQEGARSQ